MKSYAHTWQEYINIISAWVSDGGKLEALSVTVVLTEVKVKDENSCNYLFFYMADLQSFIHGNKRLFRGELRRTREEGRPVLSASTDFKGKKCSFLTEKVKS